MTGGNRAENRLMDALDEKRAMNRVLTSDERRAYEILCSPGPHSDKDIEFARKKYQSGQLSLAMMSAVNKLARAMADEKTPVEAQKDLLPYILPKQKEDVAVTVKQDDEQFETTMRLIAQTRQNGQEPDNL